MVFEPVAFDTFLVEDGLVGFFDANVLFCAFEGILPLTLGAREQKLQSLQKASQIRRELTKVRQSSGDEHSVFMEDQKDR